MNTTEDFIAGCLAGDAHRPDDGCHLLDYNGAVRDYTRNFAVSWGVIGTAR